MEHNKKASIKGFLSGVFVATAIGGYFLFGSKNAKRNRQKVEDSIDDAKADVMARLKKIKVLSKDKYYEIVDDVSEKYSKIKKIGAEKMEEFKNGLKNKWEDIEKEAREDKGGK